VGVVFDVGAEVLDSLVVLTQTLAEEGRVEERVGAPLALGELLSELLVEVGRDVELGQALVEGRLQEEDLFPDALGGGQRGALALALLEILVADLERFVTLEDQLGGL